MDSFTVRHRTYFFLIAVLEHRRFNTASLNTTIGIPFNANCSKKKQEKAATSPVVFGVRLYQSTREQRQQALTIQLESVTEKMTNTWKDRSWALIKLLALACLALIAGPTTDAFVPTRIRATSAPSHRTTQQHPLSSLAQLVDEPLAWNAVIGEADRAFRRGNQLDKSGQPRLASDAFHEAATLFQCFLELPENFGHVTNLNKEDCQAVLAYTLVRLGFISAEALSDANAAVRLYT